MRTRSLCGGESEKFIFDLQYWLNVLTEIFTKETCAMNIVACMSLCVPVSMVTLLFTSCCFLPVSNRMYSVADIQKK